MSKSELEYMADFEPLMTTTRTKIVAALRRIGVDKIPEDIEDLRRAILESKAEESEMLKDIHANTKRSSLLRDGVLRAVKQFITHVDPDWVNKKR